MCKFVLEYLFFVHGPVLFLHGTQALALDMLGEHSEHWTFFEKQLTLRAQLYATPTSHLDHAMTSVKCVRMMF